MDFVLLREASLQVLSFMRDGERCKGGREGLGCLGVLSMAEEEQI